MQLKCESEPSRGVPARVAFRVAVGGKLRGPAAHDFSETAVGGLPRELQEWDLRSAVDPATQTFAVAIELAPELQLARR